MSGLSVCIVCIASMSPLLVTLSMCELHALNVFLGWIVVCVVQSMCVRHCITVHRCSVIGCGLPYGKHTYVFGAISVSVYHIIVYVSE